MNTNDNPRVVILGAGFGGLRAAQWFLKRHMPVTLVDRQNYHLFQPLLYQVATSTLAANEIAMPVRGTVRNSKDLTFHMGDVQRIDLSQQCVITDHGEIPYDYLVIALGGETNHFGNAEIARTSLGLKTLEDAVAIRNHLLGQFEKAVHEPDAQRRQAQLTFVIAGGGPTGVECAGAIAELIRTVLHKDYPTIDLQDVRVELIEGAGRLLLNLPEDLGENAAQVLREKQVNLIFHTLVSGYDGENVTFHDGNSRKAGTFIWTAGVRAVHILDGLGLAKDHLGRIQVLPTLQIESHPQVFVIGDDANLKDAQGNPLPMLAPVAMQQAQTAAENVRLHMQGQPLRPFVYHDPGVMATIGRGQAVALLGRWRFHGWIGWVMWLGVHIIQLMGFRNRLAVLLDWAWSYLFFERAARLIGPE